MGTLSRQRATRADLKFCRDITEHGTRRRRPGGRRVRATSYFASSSNRAPAPRRERATPVTKARELKLELK